MPDQANFSAQHKPWLKMYSPLVPASLEPYPDSTLLQIVRQAADERPDHPFMSFKGRQTSLRQFMHSVDAFAAALTDLGVRKGDRVALLLPNTPHMMMGQLGAWAIGAVAVPMNPMYTSSELEHTLLDSGAETAVVLTPFYSRLKQVQAKTRLRHIIAARVKNELPPLLGLLFGLLKEEKEGHRIALQSGDYWWSELLQKHRGSPPSAVQVGLQDFACLFFSGGTTGTPKAAVATHRALLATAVQLHAWFAGLLVDWDDVIALTMPLFHVYGNVGVMCTGLVGHNRLALVPNPRDLPDLLATIRQVKPAFLPGVPTLFNALLNHPDVQAGKYDFRPIKLCISGAAPLMEETKRRFEHITGGRMIEAYAMTETMCSAVCAPPTGTYKPGSAGVPLPDVMIRIGDAETGEGWLAPGEVGEICFQTPALMQGYWGQPAETANMLREGWLYSGDLGYLDEDGYLFIVDRKKDLIKPGGFQVWPREVEEVLAAHPAVAEVGVAGVPDAYQGEAVKAWIVLRAGMQASEEDLRAWCRARLAAYKLPKHFEFRDSLPKSTVGKVLRRELVSSQ